MWIFAVAAKTSSLSAGTAPVDGLKTWIVSAGVRDVQRASARENRHGGKQMLFSLRNNEKGKENERSEENRSPTSPSQ
jgi:hypothetical protein